MEKKNDWSPRDTENGLTPGSVMFGCPLKGETGTVATAGPVFYRACRLRGPIGSRSVLKAVDTGMRNEFTAIVEQDGPWHMAYCADVPGANGQGATREACLANGREAIALILEHRREESFRCIPPDAKQELVVVG